MIDAVFQHIRKDRKARLLPKQKAERVISRSYGHSPILAIRPGVALTTAAHESRKVPVTVYRGRKSSGSVPLRRTAKKK